MAVSAFAIAENEKDIPASQLRGMAFVIGEGLLTLSKEDLSFYDDNAKGYKKHT